MLNFFAANIYAQRTGSEHKLINYAAEPKYA